MHKLLCFAIENQAVVGPDCRSFSLCSQEEDNTQVYTHVYKSGCGQVITVLALCRLSQLSTINLRDVVWYVQEIKLLGSFFIG